MKFAQKFKASWRDWDWLVLLAGFAVAALVRWGWR